MDFVGIGPYNGDPVRLYELELFAKYYREKALSLPSRAGRSVRYESSLPRLFLLEIPRSSPSSSNLEYINNVVTGKGWL